MAVGDDSKRFRRQRVGTAANSEHLTVRTTLCASATADSDSDRERQREAGG
jgi:hypothetical protein